MEKTIIVKEIHSIIFVGKHEYPEKKTIFSPRELSYQELIYNFSGDLTIEFNAQTLRTLPNTIRYLPSGTCNKYVVDRKEYGECIDIFFAADKLLFNEAFVVDTKNEKLPLLFKKVFSLWIQKSEGYYMECISLLYKILAEMQKTNYLSDSLFQKIKPAVEYIQENFRSTEPITAEKLVSLCGVSYSYIKKIFALKYKISPKRYILQLKMNYACDLLNYTATHYTVSQVAESCGYNDIYTFSRQFKTEFGISPTDFRKKYKSSK